MKEQDLGRGQHVVGFSTQEELYEYLAAQRQASIDAMDYVLPAQSRLNFGSFCYRVVSPDLEIWGRILREDEIDDPEELAMTIDARTRGLIYGKWFSEVVPEGEYGSAHIIQCWPITPEEFEEGMSLHWKIWPELLDRIQAEIRRDQEEVQNRQDT